jgi:hypothetical protein
MFNFTIISISCSIPTIQYLRFKRYFILLFIITFFMFQGSNTLAAGKPCVEVNIIWNLPYRVPVSNAPFAVYDHNKKVLYRGQTDKDGIARICIKQLPADATIQANPDESGSSPPKLIFQPKDK